MTDRADTADESDPLRLWIRRESQAMREDYERFQTTAREGDPQQSGHGAESVWLKFFESWLPPQYRCGSRKYIVPPGGGKPLGGETDLIIFDPSYPDRLCADSEVLAGGVAAAFSVKLTLDAPGIQDGIDRAVTLKRASRPLWWRDAHMVPRPPFLVGLLAQGHGWAAETATRTAQQNLLERESASTDIPIEGLDVMTIADLATWYQADPTVLLAEQAAKLSSLPPSHTAGGVVMGLTVCPLEAPAQGGGPLYTMLAAVLRGLALLEGRSVHRLAAAMEVNDEMHGTMMPRYWARADAIGREGDFLTRFPWDAGPVDATDMFDSLRDAPAPVPRAERRRAEREARRGPR